MTTTCDRCGAELQIGDFPFCNGDPARHQPYGGGVTPDDIPGGMLIAHGLCHDDGTPRKFYSKSEIAREAKQRGWTNYVRHVGERGSGKSPHTSRWI